MENLFLKKLQIKANSVVKVVDAPENAAAIFGDIPPDIFVKYAEDTAFDVLITFSITKAQLNTQIESNLKSINTKTIFWVFYPKKSSKIPSDLDLMKTWKELSVYELSPCASAAVNEIWTGLRLKLASEVKHSGLGNEQIKSNEYGDYIDPVKKIVKIPEDLAAILSLNSNALNYFDSLSYSNKKEYVLWILIAKQDKTRETRIKKTIELLSIGKKNPTAKV
ncbi:YdeI/OmpD-associated family protein [Pedobacter jamesrossensis]|uniref:YdeI/OmpD-associated family protein n=1 Tax=Pedobacter jamesrossensis TaxID=1908238 RepID=A0ABV8NG75_9SPHI